MNNNLLGVVEQDLLSVKRKKSVVVKHQLCFTTTPLHGARDRAEWIL